MDHFKRGYRERTNQRERGFHDYEGGGGPNSNNNNGGSNNNSGGVPRNEISRYINKAEEKGDGPMSPRLSSGSNNAYGGGRGNGGGRSASYGNRGGDAGDEYPRRRSLSSSFGGGRGRGGRGRGGRESSYRDGFRGGRGDRRPYGDRDDRRGGQQIIMGLDIQALVDRLVRPGCDVFRELGITRGGHMAVFQSGKAVTAIISNLARRRNLRIANAVWDWIDYIGIEKNTFHYNSMISACEKVRDCNKALRLLDEMKEKKVAKNEVT